MDFAEIKVRNQRGSIANWHVSVGVVMIGVSSVLRFFRSNRALVHVCFG